jgi:tetratricopeptide (TPR) repeat protein
MKLLFLGNAPISLQCKHLGCNLSSELRVSIWGLCEMQVEWAKFVGCVVFGLFCLPMAWCAEVGKTVVAKSFVKIEQENKAVDSIGPGQLLKVLEVQGNKILVSRGQPGWIPESSVVPLEQAEQHFSRVFATGAGAADYLARGNVRVATGKTQEGLADLKRAVELSGTDKLPYFEALAYGHLKAHDQVAAVGVFDQALQLKSAATTFMGRGLAYYQMGRLDEAAADFQKAIEQDSNHAFSRKYFAAVLHDQGKLQDAKAQLDAALKIDPRDSFTHVAAGRLHYDLRQYDEALQMFEKAIVLDKSDVEALVGRGVVLHAIGSDLAGSKSSYEAAIRLSKPSMETAYLWSNLGQVETELEQIKAASNNLDKAIELDSTFLEARSHRAYLIGKHFANDAKKLEQAKEDLRLVFKTTSQARTFWDYRALALIYQVLGNTPLVQKARADAVRVADSLKK